MRQIVLDKSLFLNVDLDIISRSDLQPLVDAMGGQIFTLFSGRVKRHFEAHLEVEGSALPSASHLSTPESLILRFCKVIRELPPDARRIWDDAKTRSFDIGIGSGKPDRYYWFDLSPKALQAALEVNARIAVTIYGPMKRVSRKRKTASAT